MNTFGSVPSWLAIMQGNGTREEKSKAHEQLEQFQKSVCFRFGALDETGWLMLTQTEAWNITHSILQSSEASIESKLFAATTLKGKVIQIPDLYTAKLIKIDHI